jgi:two-component SAPR family response regulator
MQKLINKLQAEFPKLRFVAAKQFYWSPESGEIFYNQGARGQQAMWSLLHETGHALLGHKSYEADFELIRLEVAAWERAQQLAERHALTIDEDHIQDCLDTYRDWLYKRSICPTCTTKCLQQGDFVHYRCFNCHTTWRVTASRFCRAYRRQKNVIQLPTLHPIN